MFFCCFSLVFFHFCNIKKIVHFWLYSSKRISHLIFSLRLFLQFLLCYYLSVVFQCLIFCSCFITMLLLQFKTNWLLVWGFLCFIHPPHFQVQNSGKDLEKTLVSNLDLHQIYLRAPQFVSYMILSLLRFTAGQF